MIGVIQNMVGEFKSTGRVVTPPGGDVKGLWKWLKKQWYGFANLFAECPPDGTNLPC